MAHIPKDDVVEIFEENQQRTWQGLQQTLQKHKGKTDGIEDSVIDTLTLLSQQMAQSNQPYPHSTDQLLRVLENELAKAVG